MNFDKNKITEILNGKPFKNKTILSGFCFALILFFIFYCIFGIKSILYFPLAIIATAGFVFLFGLIYFKPEVSLILCLIASFNPY